MDVQFSGIDLDADQKDWVNRSIERFEKACDADELHINLKEHKKAGDRSSYTAQLRAIIGSDIFTSEVTDWDFKQAVKSAFKKLERELN